MEVWASFLCAYVTYLKIALCRYDVSGYPTIKCFPKTNKDGEDYEGRRDTDSFVGIMILNSSYFPNSLLK